mgnify:CR=1 FL=1
MSKGKSLKKYGKTDSDKWATEISMSREIVREILNFGIKQEQIYQIINLLSLELENRDHMLLYTEVFKKTQESSLEGDESSSKIILDS